MFRKSVIRDNKVSSPLPEETLRKSTCLTGSPCKVSESTQPPTNDLPPYERKYLCLEVNPTTNQRPTSLLWEPDTYLLMRDNMTKSTLTTTNPRPTSLWEICLEVIDNDRNRNRISIVDVSNDERDNGDSSPFALLFQHAGVIITTLVAVVIN